MASIWVQHLDIHTTFSHTWLQHIYFTLHSVSYSSNSVLTFDPLSYDLLIILFLPSTQYIRRSCGSYETALTLRNPVSGNVISGEFSPAPITILLIVLRVLKSMNESGAEKRRKNICLIFFSFLLSFTLLFLSYFVEYEQWRTHLRWYCQKSAHTVEHYWLWQTSYYNSTFLVHIWTYDCMFCCLLGWVDSV